jgi:pSer/pThr/pTyr-binding forkhead associated (FHA) protein
MRLVVVEEGTQATLEFRQRVVRVGRAIDNDVRLAGALASRHHCRIELEGDGAWVIDLGSSNGTQVNGRRVERKLLRPGDVLGVGAARLQVELEGEDAPPSADDTQTIKPEDLGGSGHETLTGAAQKERDNLRVFSHITRALVAETELAPLLRMIVDAAVSLVGGERGFLLLAGAGDDAVGPAEPTRMRVRVARSFDKSDIPIPVSRVSMGIARRVAQSGRPLLSVDAGRDERFQDMASVEDLKLRSVLCLPIEIERRL